MTRTTLPLVTVRVLAVALSTLVPSLAFAADDQDAKLAATMSTAPHDSFTWRLLTIVAAVAIATFIFTRNAHGRAS